MSRYIRLDDALKAYNEAMSELVKWQMEEWQLGDFSECEFNTTDCKHIARKIEAIPTVDAVNVVRCKECWHGKRIDSTDGVFTHMCDISDLKWRADDFCSYGEREDE